MAFGPTAVWLPLCLYVLVVGHFGEAADVIPTGHARAGRTRRVIPGSFNYYDDTETENENPRPNATANVPTAGRRGSVISSAPKAPLQPVNNRRKASQATVKLTVDKPNDHLDTDLSRTTKSVVDRQQSTNPLMKSKQKPEARAESRAKEFQEGPPKRSKDVKSRSSNGGFRSYDTQSLNDPKKGRKQSKGESRLNRLQNLRSPWTESQNAGSAASKHPRDVPSAEEELYQPKTRKAYQSQSDPTGKSRQSVRKPTGGQPEVGGPPEIRINGHQVPVKKRSAHSDSTGHSTRVGRNPQNLQRTFKDKAGPTPTTQRQAGFRKPGRHDADTAGTGSARSSQTTAAKRKRFRSRRSAGRMGGSDSVQQSRSLRPDPNPRHQKSNSRPPRIKSKFIREKRQRHAHELSDGSEVDAANAETPADIDYRSVLETKKMFPIRNYPPDFRWSNRFKGYERLEGRDVIYPRKNETTVRIYLMRHIASDRECVIKLAEYHKGGTENGRVEQLANEIRLLSQITPVENVVKFYSAFVDDVPDEVDGTLQRSLCMVVEYLNGTDLYNANRRGDLKGERMFRPLAKDILIGLRGLHRRGYSHGDLKSENVMLHRPAGGLPMKAIIIDVGLCVKLRADGELRGHAMTTASAMPPELMREHANNDAGDYFAFGVLSHEIIVGTFPFEWQLAERARYSYDPVEARECADEAIAQIEALTDLRAADVTNAFSMLIRAMLTVDWRERREYGRLATQLPWFNDDVFGPQMDELERREHEHDDDDDDDDRSDSDDESDAVEDDDDYDYDGTTAESSSGSENRHS